MPTELRQTSIIKHESHFGCCDIALNHNYNNN